MQLIVDAFGGDNAPHEIIKGCVQAVKELNVNIVLVGKEDEIFACLKEYTYPTNRITVKHAEEVITNDDSPVNAIRTKKDSSLIVGLSLLKNGEGDAFLTAGNTGAYLAGAFKVLGRIKGVKRPALTTCMPTSKGMCIVLDVGANADCKPDHLLQFAIMGSIYAEYVLGIQNPKVGLVNVGTEEGKGNELTKEAFGLIGQSGINFIGNMEARQIPEGAADVVVCDGFVGNVILKLTEGVGQIMYDMIKDVFTKNTMSKLAAVIVKPGLREFKKKMDYTEYGGAPLLGINGVAIKAHGSSNAKAIFSAIKGAIGFYQTQVNQKIKEQIDGVDSHNKEE